MDIIQSHADKHADHFICQIAEDAVHRRHKAGLVCLLATSVSLKIAACGMSSVGNTSALIPALTWIVGRGHGSQREPYDMPIQGLRKPLLSAVQPRRVLFAKDAAKWPRVSRPTASICPAAKAVCQYYATRLFGPYCYITIKNCRRVTVGAITLIEFSIIP